jgi:beta propeller repeat protein
MFFARRFPILILPVLLALVVVMNAAPASQPVLTGTEHRITDNLAGQYDPAISGNLVVYTDNRGADMDVWYYDLTTHSESPVTVATGDQELTDVSDGQIVFTDYQTTDVLLFEAATGSTVNLTAESGSISLNPAIGQGLIAWEDRRAGNTDIWASVAGQPEVRISLTTRDDRSPSVGDGIIAWQSCIAGICDIYAYDWAAGATRQITATDGDERRPDVNAGRIVYEGRRGADADIYVFDLASGTERQLALPGDQINANISGGFVAFEELVTGVSHIRLWHLPSGEVFDLPGVPTTSSQFLNDIDANRIVYTDDRYGQLDIFMYEFTLTLPSDDTTPPEIAIAGCPTSPVVLGAAASVTVTVADVDSGVASQSHANGVVPLDTSAVGVRTLAVEAVDGAGNAGSASCAYRVVYGMTGFLPPVSNAPAVNPVRFGRTVPVKWQLRNANGSYISDLGAVASIGFAPVDGFATVPDGEIDFPLAGASGLRYDPAANQFVFTWKTDADACRSSCVLMVRLNDGTEHTANFSVK